METQEQVPSSPTPKTADDSAADVSAAVDSAAVDSASVDSASVDSAAVDTIAGKHPLGNAEAQGFDCAPTDESSTPVKENTALHTAVDSAAGDPITGKHPLGNAEAQCLDCAPTDDSSPPTKENTELQSAVDSPAGDPIASKHPLGNAESQGFDCVPTDESSLPFKENTALPSDAACHFNALLDKITRQVEYYFSDENLPNDKFLLKKMRKDKDGYVPVTVIASFIKMKKLTKDLSIIEAALRTSSLIVLSSDGKKVKRLHPLPFVEVRNVKPQTVLVENLPVDHSEDNIRRIFGTVGRILEVTIHDPHSKEASAIQNKADLAISKKLHALIEYDTVEAAESAVSTLNDESNWSGMRVQLLLKRMAKYGRYGLSQRGQKDVPLEKNEKSNGVEASEMPASNQDGLEREEEKKLINGGKRRSKTRGRGQHHQPTSEREFQEQWLPPFSKPRPRGLSLLGWWIFLV